MASTHSKKSGLKTLLEILALLAFLGVAAKKAMEWLQQWESSAQEQGIAKDMMKLMNEKFQNASKQYAEKTKSVKSKPEAKVAVAKSVVVKKQPAPKIVVEPLNLNTRQEKIYSMLRQRGEMNMQTITSQFKDVSSRTLRRDMTQLESLGLVNQSGRTKNSTYKLGRA